MEDKNWLCLGLSSGGYLDKSIVRDGSSDSNEEEKISNKLMGGDVNVSNDSVQNFFQLGIEKHNFDSQQKIDSVSQTHQIFWKDLGRHSDGDGSTSGHNNLSHLSTYQELWVSSNKAVDFEEERSMLKRHKSQVDNTDIQLLKHGRIVNHVDTRNYHNSIPSMKGPHVPASIKDGSTGENEDAAEMKAEDSVSGLISQWQPGSKSPTNSIFIDKNVAADPNVFDAHGKNQLGASGNESNLNCGRSTIGTPSGMQRVAVPTAMTLSSVKPANISTANGPPNSLAFSSVQLMPVAHSEPLVQTIKMSNLKPETTTSWLFGSQLLDKSSSSGRGIAKENSMHSEDDVKIIDAAGQAPCSSSGTSQDQGLSEAVPKRSGKLIEESATHSFPQTADEHMEKNINVRPEEVVDQSVRKGFPKVGAALRSGMAPDVKIGGCGTHPDLPWVSTTGNGPNGKTISGVTYKYNRNQIKVVCACHGTHFSPEEFVEHANADLPNTEK